MEATPRHLPPLPLPAFFDTLEQSEPMEILTASKIASRMLWPEVAEERSRSLYMTLALRKIHDLLLATDKEQANTIFTELVEYYFGDWQQYSQNLVLANFPSQGKGSIAERAWQGGVAAILFLYAVRNEVSLTAAAKAVSDEFRNPALVKDLYGLNTPAPENIMKNYWPRFQSVAHFWAATRYFVMPECAFQKFWLCALKMWI
ncbi:MAG: hypothetical protein LBM64_02955 [Deltaproteobacteria bacterium]|nr:hypothetical protein [Deltaproteobacteria bacterium]